ncbi:MAG: hypothetical protein IH996_03150 [Proteobacteria bacterium]|nr:hypothetical protein [Pseudomonadota bacterium]
MTDTYFAYDKLVQNALKGVVKEVLQQVEKSGLQNEHHFYIAFRTQADGVEIPKHLIERYPDEITIVLQHRFWGLKVYDDRFEVGLSFNRKPEHLKIPFDAIIAFADPSAQFALQFDGETGLEATPENDSLGRGAEVNPEQDAVAPDTEEEQSDRDGGDAKVVTLDAFRQK